MVPESPGGVGNGFGPGLGGVLSIGPGLGRKHPSKGPVADPSDVRAVAAGYGATGAQVVVDRAYQRPADGAGQAAGRQAAERQAADRQTAANGGTSAEGSQGAEQQDHG